MNLISSAQNQKVKRLRDLFSSAKARKKNGMFVAEGKRICYEIPEDRLAEVWLSQSAASENGNDVSSFFSFDVSCPVNVIPDSLFADISDTVTPQGILCVVKIKRQEDTGISYFAGYKNKCLLLLLEGLQDPGNMGSIFRTAEAAGVSGILLDKNCADVYSPKVVRSTMGAVLRVPFVFLNDAAEAVRTLNENGFTTVSACPESGTDFKAAEYTDKTAVLIGNEGFGLKKETVAAASEKVFIPMKGKTESLNASVAAALMMYEAARHMGL